jgi:DNA (cytosine-5)-methyltransferase 1
VTGPKVGALFAGYGGLELALQRQFGAIDLRWYAEKSAAPAAVLASHWPDAPNLGDVTEVNWHDVEKVDVITGGTPCQDLSHAGPRGGMTEGTRSNLWVAMREAIAVLRPRWVVWENVRGALSARADSNVEPCPGCLGDAAGIHLRALGRVLGDLASLGYDAKWYGLRASDVGAPHVRWRVFVLADSQPLPQREPGDAERVAGTAG